MGYGPSLTTMLRVVVGGGVKGLGVLSPVSPPPPPPDWLTQSYSVAPVVNLYLPLPPCLSYHKKYNFTRKKLVSSTEKYVKI